MLNSADKSLGLLAQSMGGPKAKPLPAVSVVDTSAGVVTSYTAAVACVVTIWAVGGGAGGPASGTNGAAGGGAAGRRTLVLYPGQTIAWTYSSSAPVTGADGQDIVVTLPNGTALTAGGGKTTASTTGGVGGVCSGAWDLARTGGAGGNQGVAGNAGQNGAAGGTYSGGTGAGGGGAAGFTDIPGNTFITGAGGNQGNVGVAPGGGGAPALGGSIGRLLLVAAPF